MNDLAGSGARYFVARGLNNQPTLMHRTTLPFGTETICGMDVSQWSRAWLERVLTPVYCLKCMRKEAKEAEERR